MKIYVATKPEHREAARAAMRLLRGDGHTIAHDPTCWDGFDGFTEARRIVAGVGSCDVVIAIQGGAFESGVAWAANKRVVIVGDKRATVFEDLSDVYRVPRFNDARALLRVWEGLGK